ncbi:hypothetical protein EYF80_058872 [Liparis tanakae]|uniref:Uncharacterized protein n=1 Tax=Liparis tanakae TaxID=230148 RepID=A0A4Z2EQA1_9TELE|nr:hypothetical protein EYF80_058872 [Liparis tanakae]
MGVLSVETQRIRNFLAEAVIPAIPNPSTILLQGTAEQWLQTNLQILEHYRDTISTTKQDLGQTNDVDNQEAWQVAVKWVNKKIKSLHPDALGNAAEDLGDIGIIVNRFPKKQPLPSLMATSQPSKSQTQKLPHPPKPTPLPPTQTTPPSADAHTLFPRPRPDHSPLN